MDKKTRIRVIIYGVLFVLAIILLVFWSLFNSARSRDYDRLADMRILESHLNSYFFKYNTYIIPECASGSVVNFCNSNGDRVINLSHLKDPINDSNMRYVFSELSDNNFRVEFYLETNLAGLSKGVYALTPAGLGR